MKIAWLKVGGLWPLETGGRLRSFHTLAELSRRHEVTLLTTHAPEVDVRPLEAALPACRVVSIPHAIPKRGSAGFARALLASWCSTMPVDVWKFRVPALRRVVEEELHSGAFDLCVADFLSAMPNVPLETGVPVLLFAHNVEHLIWKRLAEVAPVWQRPLLRLEHRKMQRWEASATSSATLTVAVSAKDADRLRQDAPAARVEAVDTGVDLEFFSPSQGPDDGRTLVFLGAMDWHPNEDAVLHFAEQILPRVRRRVPNVRFAVVGRNPGPRVRALAAEPGVTVTGTVDDVRPHVAPAALFVVPLRVGGGTRLKIFEAMAMGKAVVSTSIGAEGLPVTSGTDLVLADGAEAFAAAVADLLRDPSRRRALGTAARRLVEARFGWPRIAEQFAQRCELALAARTDCDLPVGATARGLSGRVRGWLAASIVRPARLYARLGAAQRRAYVQSRFGRGAINLDGLRRRPDAVGRVLFVCYGNIMRSPMAAALFQRAVAHTPGARSYSGRIASAGLHARPGHRADPRARWIARRLGVTLDAHQAQPVTAALLADSEQVFVMDCNNRAELLDRFPGVEDKVFMLGACLDGGLEIEDPFAASRPEMERSFRQIDEAVRFLSGLPVEAGSTRPDPPHHDSEIHAAP